MSCKYNSSNSSRTSKSIHGATLILSLQLDITPNHVLKAWKKTVPNAPQVVARVTSDLNTLGIRGEARKFLPLEILFKLLSGQLLQ